MANIHATSVVDSKAQIASDVAIGAYSIIGPNVKIDSGCWIGHHVSIQGHTHIGPNNRIFHFNSIGEIPQDMKYKNEPTLLNIGSGNTIREFCTLNCGTTQGGGETKLGNNNWIMAYVHVAHDCIVGNNIILANAVQLAGHVTVGDWAILGGMTAVHQYVRIGAHCLTRGGTGLTQDLPPFIIAAGDMPHAQGVNIEGLKRRGFSTDALAAIRNAYKILYRSGLGLEEARDLINKEAASFPELKILANFLAAEGRGIVR